MLLLQHLYREIVGLVDLFLPASCPLCGVLLPSEKSWAFCPDCLAGFHPVQSPHCPRCQLPYPAGEGHDHLCQPCLVDPPPFRDVRSAGLFENSLRRAVHRFKFRGDFSLDRALGGLLIESLDRDGPDPVPDLVIPVPLHVSRLRQRGYNQSLLLARVLGRYWKKPVPARLLVRSRPTLPQQGLKAAERRRNLKGAFAMRAALDGERVLLVDDVMTTGTTARECSRTLLSAGAGEVAVAVLGRAPLQGS